jgi:hypothetical protein
MLFRSISSCWSGKEVTAKLIVIGMNLLLATLACYTPWHKVQTEREAIAMFSTLESSIYKPPDAVLVAECYFNARSNIYAFAGVERIYAVPRACEDIVGEYEDAMVDSGWSMGSKSCDHSIWLDMHTSNASFLLQAKPSEGSRLAEEWDRVSSQRGDLYYMVASLGVLYEP